MKYVSIDIETTGLDSETCQILSVGAVIADTEKKLPLSEMPKFHVAIKRRRIEGEIYAINMNSKLIETILYYQEAESQDEKNDLVHMHNMQFIYENELVEKFYQWLYVNGFSPIDDDYLDGGYVKINENNQMVPCVGLRTNPISITVAGANFDGFDRKFLSKIRDWNKYIKMERRSIDPSQQYVDWKTDVKLPSLNECLKRAKLKGDVTHNALLDAYDVVRVLETKY